MNWEGLKDVGSLVQGLISAVRDPRSVGRWARDHDLQRKLRVVARSVLIYCAPVVLLVIGLVRVGAPTSYPRVVGVVLGAALLGGLVSWAWRRRVDLWDDLRLDEPVRWGAISAYGFAALLGLAWVLTAMALEGELRPWPVELATLADRNAGLFMWAGIVWFGAHMLAMPLVGALFLAHADEQRPALWFFSVTMGLAVVMWMAFGLLSIPLGANVGPHFGEAVARAKLTDDQPAMWLSRCTVEEGERFADAKVMEESCRSQDESLLLGLPRDVTGLTDPQAEQLQRAWAVAQDAWMVRKISDAVYFGANGLASLAFIFFAIYVASSPKLNSAAITMGVLIAFCWTVGFLAFEYPVVQWLVVAGLGLQLAWLLSVGTDLWAASMPGRFARDAPGPPKPVRAPDLAYLRKRGVRRICAEPDPVARNKLITLSYHELAKAIDAKLHIGATVTDPRNANWCHFAAWASRSVGNRLVMVGDPDEGTANFSLESTLGELSAALAEGNRTVFEEVAPAFLRLVDALETTEWRNAARAGEACASSACTARRCQECQINGPLCDERKRLGEAFSMYCKARRATGKKRAQLIYSANLRVVHHEQQRLQPIIQDAMRAKWGTAVFYPASLVKLPVWLILVPLLWTWHGAGELRKRLAIRMAIPPLASEEREREIRARYPQPGPVGPIVQQQTACAERWVHGFLQGMFGSGLDRLVTIVTWPTPWRGWKGRMLTCRIALRVGEERVLVGKGLPTPTHPGNWTLPRIASFRWAYCFPPELGVGQITDPLVEQLTPCREQAGLRIPVPRCFRVDQYERLDDRMSFIAVLFRSRQQMESVFEPPYSAAEARTAAISF